MPTQEPQPFVARLRKPGLHSRLRRTAELLGTSMNDIVESAIEHELAYIANDIHAQLERTLAELDRLRLSDVGVEADIESFGEAEAAPDPIRATMIEDDLFEIGVAFAPVVE